MIVFGAPPSDPRNRGIGSISFGGGLPPLAGRRTEAAVSVLGDDATDTVGVRLYIDGQVRAAATAPAGATVRLPAGPFPPGRVEGYAEIDPDPLTGDDRRYFAFTVRDPTPVTVLGAAPFFLTEALAVLEESDRIALGGPGRAVTLVSIGGEGIERRGVTQSAFIAPHPDPTQLPALNRRLAEAGIPFRYDSEVTGGARVAVNNLAIDVSELQIRRFFRLVSTGAPGLGGTEPAVTLSSGDPWLTAGDSPLRPLCAAGLAARRGVDQPPRFGGDDPAPGVGDRALVRRGRRTGFGGRRIDHSPPRLPPRPCEAPTAPTTPWTATSPSSRPTARDCTSSWPATAPWAPFP